jgi:hypothetical protein
MSASSADLHGQRMRPTQERGPTSRLGEEESRRLTCLLPMLCEIDTAITRIENPLALLDEACRLAHGVGGYRVAIASMMTRMTRMAQLVGWADHRSLTWTDNEFPLADGAPDSSLIGRVIRTGEAVLCENMRELSPLIHERERDAIVSSGVGSLACLPLRVNQKPIGALLCGTGASRPIGAEELLLLQEVASALSSALDRRLTHETSGRVDAPEKDPPSSMRFRRRDEMRDSFDYETYWWIIDRLSRTNRPLRFSDLANGLPSTPFFILRHDVDYSPAAALELAREEARRGINSTYFLLLNGLHYNMLSPEHATLGAELAAMGHEVGLHYDVKFLEAFPRHKWSGLIRRQATLLGDLSGTPVTAIAMHQPGLNPEDPLRETTEYVNAYDDRFCREMPYFSDSCRAWWDAAWEMLTSGPTPPRLQLALHPINWAERDRDRETIFRSLHFDLARSVISAGNDLLQRITEHPGVLQHTARRAKS